MNESDTVTAPYRCPTLCDDDCEINGWGCHEAHGERKRWEHDPGACEALALAGNLRWLADNGWQFQYGRLRDRCAPEPYWACLTNAPTLKFQRQDGASLGEVALRAREWAQQRGVPGWTVSGRMADAPGKATPWWLCPNEPRCPHARVFHDVEDYDDPLPRCCAEGCDCGKRPAPVAHLCPPEGVLTPCCGKTPLELPGTDRITEDPSMVTCAAGCP